MYQGSATTSKVSIESTTPLQRPGGAPASPTSGSGFWGSIGRVLIGGQEGSGADTHPEGNNQASTGRGGAGNIVRGESTSRSRPEDEGAERGRNIYASEEPNRVTHAGRGGQGNVRSPSRDPAKEAADRAFEEEVLRKSREHREQYGLSSGRGGTGNIDRSRSRSREPALGAGRGGAGNVYTHETHPHSAKELEVLEEEERAKAEAHPKHHHHLLFSHGRGGQGNLSEQEAGQPHGTAVAPEASAHIGRGGAGNILEA